MLGRKKPIVVEEKQEPEPNWKQAIMDSSVKIGSFEERFNSIERQYGEGRDELKKHCDDEVNDKQDLKDHICKKIDKKFGEFECPDKAVIDEMKKNGETKTNEIKDLTDTMGGCKNALESLVLNAEVNKKVWKKLAKIAGGIVVFTTLTTPFVLWLLGVFSKGGEN